MMVEFSFGIHDVAIVEIAVTDNAANNKIRRFIRFNKGIVINNPGISIATTNMKLVYRFSPGTCVAIKLSP